MLKQHIKNTTKNNYVPVPEEWERKWHGVPVFPQILVS